MATTFNMNREYDMRCKSSQTRMVMELTDPTLKKLRDFMVFSENMAASAEKNLRRAYPHAPIDPDKEEKKRQDRIGLAAAFFEREEL